MCFLKLASATCLALVVGLAAAIELQAVPFTSSYTAAGTWNTVYAQGFSPSEMISTDPGVGLLDPVSLNRFEFFKSGTADSAANFRLAIVSNIFTDLASLTTSSPQFVGLSTNTVASTAGIATNAAIGFNFDELQLTYGENYGAIFVNVSGDTLTPVLVSALTANYIENPEAPGTFVPGVNYGDPDPNFPGNFALATSNFTHTDTFGTFFDMFGGAGDARFVAYFNQEAVELEGDFSGDGSVDAADYVTLRKNAAPPADFQTWRENFGMTSGGGGSTTGHAAVPEPAAILMTMAGAAIVCCGRRLCGCR